MLKRLRQRIQCLRNQHRDTCFTSYPVGNDQLRVVRCLNCHQLLDVILFRNFSHMQSKLESKLSEVPGYPAERFR
jgi:hypothetical protein